MRLASVLPMAGLLGPTSSSMASASDPGMVTAEWITPRRTNRRISLAAERRELTVASMPDPPSSPTRSVSVNRAMTSPAPRARATRHPSRFCPSHPVRARTASPGPMPTDCRIFGSVGSPQTTTVLGSSSASRRQRLRSPSMRVVVDSARSESIDAVIPARRVPPRMITFSAGLSVRPSSSYGSSIASALAINKTWSPASSIVWPRAIVV